MSEHPHETDPDEALEDREEALLGDPDEAEGGPEERVSDMLDDEESS